MSNSYEPLLKEYESLRQEVIAKLKNIWHLEIALISASALLLGLVATCDKGFAEPISAIVPLGIFILCVTGIKQINGHLYSITLISVYIELKMEENPNINGMLRWEYVCSKIYTDKFSTSKIKSWREPFPWLALIQILCALFSGLNIAMSLLYKICYFVINTALLIYLIKKMDDLKWPKREDIRKKVKRLLNNGKTINKND